MIEENLEWQLAELVASLTPEQYEKRGPALRELGLALAQARQIERDLREILEEQTHARERVRNALRLWEAAE